MSTWRCSLCNDYPTVDEVSSYKSKEEFEKHLKDNHQDELFEEDLLSMVESSRKQEMLMPAECPVCLHEISDPEEDYVEHICACLHSFSLRSLPWNDSVPKGNTECVKGTQLLPTCDICGRCATRTYKHDDDGVDRQYPAPDPDLFCACRLPSDDVDSHASWITEMFRFTSLGALEHSDTPMTPPPIREEATERAQRRKTAFEIPDLRLNPDNPMAPMLDEEYFDQSSGTDKGDKPVTEMQRQQLLNSLTAVIDLLSGLDERLDGTDTAEIMYLSDLQSVLQSMRRAVVRSSLQARSPWLAAICRLAENVKSEPPANSQEYTQEAPFELLRNIIARLFENPDKSMLSTLTKPVALAVQVESSTLYPYQQHEQLASSYMERSHNLLLYALEPEVDCR